jgi:hypothetical protein
MSQTENDGLRVEFGGPSRMAYAFHASLTTVCAGSIAADLREARTEIERLSAERRKRGLQIHELQKACARRNAMIDALEGECDQLRACYRIRGRVARCYTELLARERRTAALWFSEFTAALGIVAIARDLVGLLGQLGPNDTLPARTLAMMDAAKRVLAKYVTEKSALNDGVTR